ncbi:MAG: hypothetical protein ACXWC4_00680 [Telluria sp.]
MTKTVEEATADLEAARAAYLSALERDCERSEGSGAQERRNDERLERLRNAEYDAEQELESAKRRQQKREDGSVAG